MTIGITYLAVNLTALYVLCRWRYQQMWGSAVALVGVTCWQIGVILLVPLSDGRVPYETRRVLAIHWWMPGEICMELLTAAAVGEICWRVMKDFPWPEKVGVLLSLVGGNLFALSILRGLLKIHDSADWFDSLKSYRLIESIVLATIAIVAFGVGCTFNRRRDPRFVRMHSGVFALLLAGHVVLNDLSTWSYHHTIYRAFEAACLLGFGVNAHLLHREWAHETWSPNQSAAQSRVRQDGGVHLQVASIAPRARRVAPAHHCRLGA